MNGLQALKKERKKQRETSDLSSPYKVQRPAALRALALLASPAPSSLLQGARPLLFLQAGLTLPPDSLLCTRLPGVPLCPQLSPPLPPHESRGSRRRLRASGS